MAAKQSIARVQLDSASKDRLDVLAAKRGMTQFAFMSRLVKWFTLQDDFIQTAVLGTLSDDALRSLAKAHTRKSGSEHMGRSLAGHQH